MRTKNMPTIVDKINTIGRTSTSPEILNVLNEIVNGADAAAVKQFIIGNLENGKDSIAAPLNVAIAGATGLVMGNKYLWPGESSKRAYEVNPFLHQLRLAMIQCGSLGPKLKENASNYFFYPEFFTGTVTMVDRIVRISHAHASMDPSNSETIPLYSLGGYFNYEDTMHALPKKGARGTTCVMTARAVYHASGAKMIGDRTPVVGTPSGPDVELGRPSAKVVQHKTMATPTVERERFKDLSVQEPALAAGDVYLIQGHGDAQFLGRPGVLDLAAHVGVVVDKCCRIFTTLDGGQGEGNAITMEKKDLTYDEKWGWSLGKSKSFSAVNLENMGAKLAQYDSDEAIVKWIQEDIRRGLSFRQRLEKLEKDKAIAKNDQQRQMIENTRPAIYSQARRLVKEGLKGDAGVGKLRTVQGWWRPSMYAELNVVGDDAVRSKLV